MASVVVKASFALDTQQLLETLEQLDTSELEAFHQAVGQLLDRRSSEQSTSLFPIAQAPTDEVDLPIVENLIPKSITLDSDRIQF